MKKTQSSPQQGQNSDDSPIDRRLTRLEAVVEALANRFADHCEADDERIEAMERRFNKRLDVMQENFSTQLATEVEGVRTSIKTLTDLFQSTIAQQWKLIFILVAVLAAVVGITKIPGVL